MDAQQLFAILTANPFFHLATAENGQPRVRGMHMFRADPDGIIFHTHRLKEVYQQLAANPDAEMCFNDMQHGVQIRVRGRVEDLPGMDLKLAIVQHPTRGYLKPWLESGGNVEKDLRVLCLRQGVAQVWTMATNYDPKQYIQL